MEIGRWHGNDQKRKNGREYQAQYESAVFVSFMVFHVEIPPSGWLNICELLKN